MGRMRISLFALALLGCSHAAPVAAPAPVPPSGAYDPAKVVEIESEDVELAARDHQVPATIVAPKMPGKWPAIVMMAGSGPTDRNWLSPLIPGTNGSGKLLAEELARHGAVVIRFDKAGIAANTGPADVESRSIDTYRDELLTALAALEARSDVRKTELFLAGHSEGGMHVIRAATEAPGRVHGLLLLSSIAHSEGDSMINQIEIQLHDPRAKLSKEAADAETSALRNALHDWMDGKEIEPMKVTRLAPIQRLLLGITLQPTKRLSRELLSFEVTQHLAGLTVPCFVLNGGHDIQVKPDVDGDYLVAALTAAHVPVERHLSPEADHVLKHEPRTLDEQRAHPRPDYNAEGRTLDPDAVMAIETWLAAHTR